MEEKKIEFMVIIDPVPNEERYVIKYSKTDTKVFNIGGFTDYLNELVSKADKFDAIMGYISSLAHKGETNGIF